MSEQIHWNEGLFLQPQHFQRFQKSLLDQFGAERRLFMDYPYGVLQARLSAEELENYRICFDRLRVVMPSGLHFNVPEDADLPTLDIKKAFTAQTRGFMVYLGVPLWFEGRANTIAEDPSVRSRLKMIYRVADRELADENTGENPKLLQMRRINAMLYLEDEDMSDMEFIPILRVIRNISEEGASLPRQDPAYVPPTLVLRGSPTLREMIRDLAAQVQAVRDGLNSVLARGGVNLQKLKGMEFEQITRLRTLNRYAARLPSLVEAGGITPFHLYLELRDLLAELLALFPGKGEFEVAPYNHDDPYPVFLELSKKIRNYLYGVIRPSFLKAEFVLTNGILTTSLTEEHLTRPVAYFLGIRTRLDPSTITRLVEDAEKFKLMPPSFGTRAVRGVALREERFPPLELPIQSGLYFYRLVTSESRRIWEQVLQERAMILHWTNASPADFDVTLYMTVPIADDETPTP